MKPISPNPPTAPSRRGTILLGGLLLVLIGLAVVAWRLGWFTPKPTPSDPVGAMQANLRGVGHMEKFEYPEAQAAFEEAVRLDPDWTPALINLGIALLNRAKPEPLAEAYAIFEEVLRKEPDNIHAHYCLGIIDMYENRTGQAFSHFDHVSKLDPRDATTWLHKGLTHPEGKESAAAKECFATALKLDPYLNAARYQLAMHPLGRNPETTGKLIDEFKALGDYNWDTFYKITYDEMGRYADVIGRRPDTSPPVTGPVPLFGPWDTFQVRLAPGTSWATGTDLGAGPNGELKSAVRERFGTTAALFDFNRDERPDVFLASAVSRDKQLADVLLRNDGSGGFTDVTAEAGLAGQTSLGCSVADYDNDGLSDLLLTGVGAPRLFRNAGEGRFENVSEKANFNPDKLDGSFFGSSWADIDQDGDLDLLVARHQGKGGMGAGFVVMLNVGEAPPVKQGEVRPLSTAFQPWQVPDGISLEGPAVATAVGDFDADRDVDVLFLADGQPGHGLWNDRLLRFHSAGELGDAADWNGALLLDVNHDQRSDLVLLPKGKSPLLWLSKSSGKAERLADGFTPGAVKSPALLQAQAVDLDSDGWTDVVGLGADHRPVFLHNDGQGKLVHVADAFGPVESLSGSEMAACADLDGDGLPDLLAFSNDKGPEVRRNLGNGNRSLQIELTGKRDKGKGPHGIRTNADGVGAWVVAQAGRLWTGQERGTMQAGLGQSSLPIGLGIGKNAQADLVRVRWPDGVIQAEFNIAPGAVVRIPETERKGSSCPVLFAWDGQRYRFVTDLLGAGALGEQGTDGSVRQSRPEESVKLEPGSLVARDGWYRIKLAEPLDELLYLDRVELVVVDHPSDWRVYPDERFVFTGPQPTQELLFLKDVRPAVKARDHQGRDVTAVLRDRDRRMVGATHRRSWLGFAAEHWTELDFGPVKPAGGPEDRLILCLHGWTDYPFPESMWAAHQAGVEVMPPLLEKPTADGTWRAWEELGFPAGLPRTMTRDVSGLLQDGDGRFRVRTNMQVAWDEAMLGRLVGERRVQSEAKINTLPVGQAVLRNRGFAQEMSPDGSSPTGYDDDRTEPVAVTTWKGRLTKLGDVRELLDRVDDCFVLCGPGDEIELEFDARQLPTVPEGHVRSFILRSVGYCKDTAPFTLTGGEVGPLPYHGMAKYPPPPLTGERAAAREEYERRWNTRQMSR